MYWKIKCATCGLHQMMIWMQAPSQEALENGPMGAKIVVSRIMLEVEEWKDDVGLRLEVIGCYSISTKQML